MAEVLSAPSPTDGGSYFASPVGRSSPSPYLPSQPSPPLCRSQSRPDFYNDDYTTQANTSAPSSAPSSPRLSHTELFDAPSLPPTPASTLSLQCDIDEDDDDDGISFPTYDTVPYYGKSEYLNNPIPATPDPSLTASSSNSTSTTNPSRPESPEPIKVAEDDTAVKREPTRHVDYLSHDWYEEDIWSSWRHVVSRRKVYGNSARLENASWRTWTKSKYRLRTVSPETLNWLKDCDVTWLYGPLQTNSARGLASSSSPLPSRLSKSNSFLNKKPILKKRSMSEIMLQKSISTSSLVKQAAAAVQAQQSGSYPRPTLGRAASDFTTSTFPSKFGSRDDSSNHPSILSSGTQSPITGERKHIHFNDKVEQCIAVEAKGGEDEDEDEYDHAIDDSEEDEGIVMKSSSKHRISPRRTPRNSFVAESKTIAMLPSTKLKYRESPEPAERTTNFLGNFWSTKTLSPSPSQETLRPSKPSANFLLDDEDNEADMSWEPTLQSSNFNSSSDTPMYGSQTDGEPASGMRRTPSGMFMPYEEDEDDIVAAGLFGRVVDTVNTARDIAHVIWNVGWRK